MEADLVVPSKGTNSIFFVGDVASIDKYNYDHHHTDFKEQLIILNFEGGLAESDEFDLYKNRKLVFNSFELLDSIFNDSFLIFNLANNHIDDVGTINRTKSAIEEKGHITVGAGDNLSEASQVRRLSVFNDDYILISFGWNVIECTNASCNRPGVNPLSHSWVLKEFTEKKKQYPHSKFIVLMHWCYELEVIPLPFQRSLAHSLVDLGCDYIVGCHPHCVQPVERYKHGIIIYSLGNWYFKENYFFSSKLRFPRYCSLQLMFELTSELGPVLHLYEKQDSKTEYLGRYSFEEFNKAIGFSDFEKIKIDDYDAFFKIHRVKTKLLPIYRTKDSRYYIAVKDIWNRFRTLLINLMVRIGAK
ncbi:CapA family protein [Idiomarina sp. MD25a]|uniref:CapA family protein n=1 Tax=Idiomarina sp. MD25a TaxID=1889913 RepID=UPI00209B09DA|nr:CapA family protein [Idiomarina sp. MD25a]